MNGITFNTELAKKIELSDSGSKYLEAGIHENVFLDSVRTGVSPNKGRGFIEFKFLKDNKIFTHTEWEPRISTETQELAERSQSKVTNQVSRIGQLLRCYYDSTLITYSGTSYDDYLKWVVGMLNSADKSVALRAKVVYNDEGYTTFPSYVKFAFVEPMVIPTGYYKEGENESRIKELSMDVFVRPVVGDREAKDANPLAGTVNVSVTASNDDPNALPF